MSTSSRDTQFEPIRTTSDEQEGELFGVHIPELQLDPDEYRAGFRAAQLTDGERYLELGSGHGNGLIIAAREFGATAVGIEYLDDAIERARAAARRAGIEDRVELIREDLRRIEPTSADVVHMHLGPAFHDVLAARMEESLTPTARVIAAGWRVPGWRPLPGTAEQWDGGYIYRPADPRMHISWFDERNERAEDVVILDARVHADIEAIEPRFDTDGPEPIIELSQTTACRGQRIAVAISRTGSPIELALWGRSRSGRLTQRGPAVTIA
jgi:SAM-dependent methyltransferase